MENKVNFTPEHKKELDSLLLDALYDNRKFKGTANATEVDVLDLLHDRTLNTLVTMHQNLKMEIKKLEDMDEWSMTPYQQAKKAKTEKDRNLISLVIGYRRNQEQIQVKNAKIKELKMQYNEILTSNMKPEDQLKKIGEEIARLGGTVEESTPTIES